MRFASPAAASFYISQAEKDGFSLCAIYGLFSDESCIYVGQSHRPHARLQQHRSRISDRFDQMRILDLVLAIEALTAEGRWIIFYQDKAQAGLNKICRCNRDIDSTYQASEDRNRIVQEGLLVYER